MHDHDYSNDADMHWDQEHDRQQHHQQQQHHAMPWATASSSGGMLGMPTGVVGYGYAGSPPGTPPAMIYGDSQGDLSPANHMMLPWMQHYASYYHPGSAYSGVNGPAMMAPPHGVYASPGGHLSQSPPSQSPTSATNGLGHGGGRPNGQTMHHSHQQHQQTHLSHHHLHHPHMPNNVSQHHQHSGHGHSTNNSSNNHNHNNSNHSNNSSNNHNSGSNNGSHGRGKHSAKGATPNGPGGKPMCAALVEYRASGRRPSMEELAGHVVEFSRDAHGSRFVQFKMETASVMEKQTLVDEVAVDAIGLMQDTFGNYVLQNFLEHATEDQRYTLGRTMKGHMVQLSSQAHGCRVVQRAILLLPRPLRNELLAELLMQPDDTSRCARNSHATHVMQKVVNLIVEEERERLCNNEPPESFLPTTEGLLRAVERAVETEFVAMGVHPHAYRLVLTVMDDCDPDRSPAMRHVLNEVLPENMDRLAKDQHGNFILQHILNRGSDAQKQMVQQFVTDHVVELAQHKFGSHLVEKCLSCANAAQVEALIKQIIAPTAQNAEHAKLMASTAQVNQRNAGAKPGSQAKGRKGSSGGSADDTLLLLMSDPYANFVVQRAFDASQGPLRNRLVDEIKSRSDVLSKFTYGRHALLHLSKVLGERTEHRGGRQGQRSGRRRK